jgi:hypothetical protein
MLSDHEFLRGLMLSLAARRRTPGRPWPYAEMSEFLGHCIAKHSVRKSLCHYI